MSATINLKIYQGATYSKKVIWQGGTPVAPINLTGCTAKMHVRSKAGDPNLLLAFTTENGGIVLGGTTGSIEYCKLSALASAAITWLTGVYDLKITFPDGTVTRKISGSIIISPEVTNV